MQKYEAKTFDLPPIDGISDKQIEEHIKLYEGYVKHVNTVFDQMSGLMEKSDYAARELWRRLGFEFNGMRNHEYYFGALEGGPKKLDESSTLYKKLEEEHGGLEGFLSGIKETSKMRGSGWVICYYDKKVDQILIGWVDEHHLGGYLSLPIFLALDCWEHAYMVDHPPSGRGEYVSAYLNALNWETVNNWFENEK